MEQYLSFLLQTLNEQSPYKLFLLCFPNLDNTTHEKRLLSRVLTGKTLAFEARFKGSSPFTQIMTSKLKTLWTQISFFSMYYFFLVLTLLVFFSFFYPLEVRVSVDWSIEEAKTVEDILMPKDHLAVNPKAVFDVGTPFLGGFLFLLFLFFKVGLKWLKWFLFLMLFPDPNDQFAPEEMIQNILQEMEKLEEADIILLSLLQEIEDAHLKSPSELEKTPTVSVSVYVQVGQVVLPLLCILYTLFKP